MDAGHVPEPEWNSMKEEYNTVIDHYQFQWTNNERPSNLAVKADEKVSIIVKNIPPELNNNGLSNIFSKAGKVLRATIHSKKDGVHRTNLGFVDYATAFEASTAISMFNRKQIYPDLQFEVYRTRSLVDRPPVKNDTLTLNTDEQQLNDQVNQDPMLVEPVLVQPCVAEDMDKIICSPPTFGRGKKLMNLLHNAHGLAKQTILENYNHFFEDQADSCNHSLATGTEACNYLTEDATFPPASVNDISTSRVTFQSDDYSTMNSGANDVNKGSAYKKIDMLTKHCTSNCQNGAVIALNDYAYSSQFLNPGFSNSSSNPCQRVKIPLQQHYSPDRKNMMTNRYSCVHKEGEQTISKQIATFDYENWSDDDIKTNHHTVRVPPELCYFCRKKAKFLCSCCRKSWYCCRNCQIEDWLNHKRIYSGYRYRTAEKVDKQQQFNSKEDELSIINKENIEPCWTEIKSAAQSLQTSKASLGTQLPESAEAKWQTQNPKFQAKPTSHDLEHLQSQTKPKNNDFENFKSQAKPKLQKDDIEVKRKIENAENSESKESLALVGPAESTIQIEEAWKLYKTPAEIPKKEALENPVVDFENKNTEIAVDCEEKSRMFSGLDQSIIFQELLLKESTFEVVLTGAFNPTHFWIQLKKNQQQLESLQNKMSEIYSLPSTANDLVVQPAMICAAYYNTKNIWCRARVLAQHHQVAIIIFIDFGKLDIVPVYDIRKLCDSMLELPAQAIEVGLANITPVNADKLWSKECLQVFLDHTLNRNVICQVISQEIGVVPKVELIIDDAGTKLSRILVERKLALLESIGISSENNATLVQGPPMFERIYPGQEVDIVFASVFNPSVFWVWLVNDETLLSLGKLEELQLVYKDEPLNLEFRPQVGDMVAAKFCQDEHWYRAIVKSVQKNRCMIYYVDLGYCESSKFEALYPLKLEYIDFPHLAIPAKLDNVESFVEGIWGDDVVLFFKNLVQSKKFHAHMINVTKSRVSLELKANDGVNLADLLIEEGYAKPAEMLLVYLESDQLYPAHSSDSSIEEKVPIEIPNNNQSLKEIGQLSILEKKLSVEFPSINQSSEEVPASNQLNLVQSSSYDSSLEEKYVEISDSNQSSKEISISDQFSLTPSTSGVSSHEEKLFLQIPSINQSSKQISASDKLYSIPSTNCDGSLKNKSPIEVSIIKQSLKEMPASDQQYHTFSIPFDSSLEQKLPVETPNINQSSNKIPTSDELNLAHSTTGDSTLEEKLPVKIPCDNQSSKEISLESLNNMESSKSSIEIIPSESCSDAKASDDIAPSNQTVNLLRLKTPSSSIIMASDIPKVKFKHEEYFSARLQNIVTPQFIYLHKVNHGAQQALDDLKTFLNNHCETLDCPPYKPKVGELIAAKFSHDGFWYRAQVVKVTSEDNIDVFFVDYGNFGTVTVLDVRPLDKKFAEMPLQAIKCYLTNVPALKWDDVLLKIFYDIMSKIAEEPCLVKILEYSNSEYGVMIYDSEDVCVNYILIKKYIQTGHLPSSSNSFPSETKLDNDFDSQNDYQAATSDKASKEMEIKSERISPQKRTLSKLSVIEEESDSIISSSYQDQSFIFEEIETLELSVGSTYDLTVVAIINPGLLFCTLSDTQAIAELLEEMNDYYAKQPTLSNFEPCVSEVYAVQSSASDHWFRGAVFTISEDRSDFGVFNIDFSGKLVPCKLKNIHPIKSHFMNLPAQGIQCELFGIVHCGETWTTEDKLKFEKHIPLHSLLTARIIDNCDDSYKLEITHINKEMCNIVETLIQEGIAKAL